MTTNFNSQPTDTDLELLSAYLDGQLSATERSALEQRLEGDPALHAALDELRATVSLLQGLTPMRPPRSFTLDARAVAPRRGWSFPWMQAGSALVAVTLLVVFGFVLTFRGGGVPSTTNSAQSGAGQPAPIAAAAPTSAPAAAQPMVEAAAATALPAAELPAAAAAIGTPAAAPTMAAADAAPAPAALLPTAPMVAAEAPSPQPYAAAEPTAASQATMDDTSIAENSASAARQGVQTAEANTSGGGVTGDATAPTNTPGFSAQIATSGSTSPDTRSLEQTPKATPTSITGSSGASGWLLVSVLAIVIAAGAWLFLRRRR